MSFVCEIFVRFHCEFAAEVSFPSFQQGNWNHSDVEMIQLSSLQLLFKHDEGLSAVKNETREAAGDEVDSEAEKQLFIEAERKSSPVRHDTVLDLI